MKPFAYTLDGPYQYGYSAKPVRVFPDFESLYDELMKQEPYLVVRKEVGYYAKALFPNKTEEKIEINNFIEKREITEDEDLRIRQMADEPGRKSNYSTIGIFEISLPGGGTGIATGSVPVAFDKQVFYRDEKDKISYVWKEKPELPDYAGPAFDSTNVYSD